MWVRTVQIRRVEVALNDEQPRENGQEGKGMTWSEAGIFCLLNKRGKEFVVDCRAW